MKKILLIAFALLCTTAVAQSRPTLIIEAGYQRTDITKSERAIPAHCLRAGVAIDYAFFGLNSYELSLQTGLYYSMKGFRSDPQEKIHVIYRMHYVDLPILLNNRFKITDALDAFVNFGPYIAYGINAKMSGTDEKGEKLEVKKNLFKEASSEDKPLFERIDYGIQVGMGVEVHRMMLSVGTQYGLNPIFKDAPKVAKKYKHIGGYVTVGYRF